MDTNSILHWVIALLFEYAVPWGGVSDGFDAQKESSGLLQGSVCFFRGDVVMHLRISKSGVFIRF